MKKSNPSYQTHLLRILAILCLLASYFWIAPGGVHALPADFQGDHVLGNEEQAYNVFDHQMVYDGWEGGYEWSTDPLQTDDAPFLVPRVDVPQTPGESNPSAPLQQTTTLEVAIISSPWAPLDSNPQPGEEVPNVFVVEAVVTNTGTVAATDLIVTLDYNEDPVNNWVLVPGEDPDRIVDSLAPDEVYYAYWFASYSITDGESHQYTVTADASNTSPVSTSDNYYGNPAPGKTVQTQTSLSTGNSGLSQASAEIVVGVAFTVTVGYNLGSNPQSAMFSPVGNPDFDPSAYRLLSSEISFYDSADALIETANDQLYFPTLNSSAARAEATFTFIALTPTNTRLCSYTAISYQQRDKYDQYYCEGTTIVYITGTLEIALTKQASSSTVQRNQTLDYTLHYTNTGDQPLSYVWIWDDVDTNIGSITTVNPASDPGESTDSRVAWNLGTIPASGQAGSTGTLAFTILISGDNQYLADHSPLVNHGFLGINPGSLPKRAALTSTVTTAIQVPVLSISKSDDPDPVLTGRVITYTLHYTNSGTGPDTNVVITDVVPSNTTYQSCSGGSSCGESGGVVTWNIGTVPNGTNDATVSFSVLVDDTLATGTLISNDDYGIVGDQTDFIPGSPVTTTASREAANIEGYAFRDDDGDGFRDAGEVGLSAVSVTLPDATTPSTTTDGNGYYGFRVEVQKPVSVTAALPAGYFRTTPGTVLLESTFGITQTVNFGYADPTISDFGVIYGTVFEDANHDGNQSGTEYGLSGVTVTSAEAATSPLTTNQLGQYTFRYNSSGPVTITETDPPFYVSTTPNVVQTNAVIDDSGPSPIDFGDFRGIKVTGQVFNDANVNGVNDDGAGVSGATVAGGGDSFTTGGSGLYTLYVAVSGSDPITVTETDPAAGYISTNAVPGSGVSKVDANTLRIDSPTSGVVYSGDFGDVLLSSVVIISGQVWDDNGIGYDRADGQRDSGEPGLAGATVSLSSGLSATTGSDGLFSLPAPPNQVITVVEANPAGYRSTNAIPGDNASKFDNDTLLVSPLSGGSTSAGHLFGDAYSGSDVCGGGLCLPIIMKNY